MRYKFLSEEAKARQRERTSVWAKTNKDRVNARNNKKHHSRKLYFIKLKGGKCSMCGGIFDRCCYDFHHIDKTSKEGKSFNFYSTSLKRMEKMLETCILLCANCHRIVHHKERNYT